MHKRKIHLIDGNHMLYRSVFVGFGMETSTGIRTGGMVIFLQALWYAIKGGNAVITFDGSRSEYRTKLYPDYKKREPKTEHTVESNMISETIDTTFKYLPFTLKALGLPVIRLPKEEADDVIYVLTKYLTQQNGTSLNVVTEDEDYLQLVDKNIDIFRPMKKDTITAENFIENVGIEKSKFTLMKSLIGDPSDNIPGIKGVGKKTAQKFLKKMKGNTLDELVQVLREEKSKIAKAIIENISIVERNMKLIDFTNCPIDEQEVITEYENVLERTNSDPKKVNKLFKRFEFTKFNQWLQFAQDRHQTI